MFALHRYPVIIWESNFLNQILLNLQTVESVIGFSRNLQAVRDVVSALKFSQHRLILNHYFVPTMNMQLEISPGGDWDASLQLQ